MATIRVSQFFKRYHVDTIVFFMMVQTLVAILSATIAWAVWQYTSLDASTTFIVCVGFLLFLQIILAPILVYIIDKPLRILSQAIAHVSKDTVQTPPPSVNSREYERSGLKAMVQTIYDLALASEKDNTQNAVQQDGPYRVIFDTVPCGIIVFNDHGQIIAHNKNAPVLASPNNDREVQLLFERGMGFKEWLASVKDNKVRDLHIWHRVANSLPDTDNRRIFDVIGYYSKESSGNIEAILVTIDRTTDYLPEEEDMDFIALAAHELRGPITIIRGYLDIIADELHNQLQTDQQELIDRLQVSAEQLSGYINNILNVSRFDRNHLKLHLHETSLLELIKSLVPDLALRAKTKRRRLSFNIPQNLPTIAADNSSLSEVLSNLIDNGIKYSADDGEVIITAAAKDNFVEVTVQDFGIGMPESVVGNLFNKFYRSHRSRQQVGGTGLGLYICKAIVESHGGGIWARSQEGRGSTFGFTIPIYATVADKLEKSDNSNEQIIVQRDGWIKNHAMYRR